MSNANGKTLDFPLLDDISLLPRHEVSGAIASIGRLDEERIGPLVEYATHNAMHAEYTPSVAQIVTGPMGEGLWRAVQKNGRFDIGTTTSLEPFPFEFQPLADSSEIAALLWRAFKNRLSNAAFKAGFDKDTSKGLAGAFGELEDNARLHSNNVPSVIVGYRWRAGEFEMVVADMGIGVLQSLKRHPDYQHLNDDGTALRTALSSGETRFGRGSGHGTGFDTVFRNLASMQGFLRFRSGDQSLELSGVSPTLIDAKLKQRAYFQGFLVSITCRPN